jgi:Putative MetA-pathway of phenol degradation
MAHPAKGIMFSALMLAATTSAAQENADVLAKQLSNPVASLISMPLQYNIDFDIGSENGTKQYLNVQPVIPKSPNEHTNLITRVIMPVIYQDDVFGNSGTQFGLGDTTPSFFFSPKQPLGGKWIVGTGPVFLLPTATDELLGSEKWGAGPTALALQQTPDGWTFGALVNHIWSFAGDDDRSDVSTTFIQPFLAKQFPGGRTLTVNLESSYDWEGEHWNVPVNLVYSQVTKYGSQMLSWAGGVRYFAETPGEGPEWGLRLVLTLLYLER